MKKTSLSLMMLAAGSLAMLACARPVMRRFDEINRRRGSKADAMPLTVGEQDMQPVAGESSMVAPGTQQHQPDEGAPPQVSPAGVTPRKDGDFAPPVGA